MHPPAQNGRKMAGAKRVHGFLFLCLWIYMHFRYLNLLLFSSSPRKLELCLIRTFRSNSNIIRNLIYVNVNIEIYLLILLQTQWGQLSWNYISFAIVLVVQQMLVAVPLGKARVQRGESTLFIDNCQFTPLLFSWPESLISSAEGNRETFLSRTTRNWRRADRTQAFATANQSVCLPRSVR